MRLLAVALVAFAIAAPPRASLKVTYWPHGRSAPATVWTLRYAPDRGTHPFLGRSCLQLKANTGSIGAATKPCMILQRAGSPEAEIVGTWAGRKVDRSYRIGCPGWSDLHLVLTGKT